MDAEMRALIVALDSQRQHILYDLDGLTEQQLRTPVLPSGWAPLALVSHLSMDVERWWFRNITAREPGLDFGDGPDAGWTLRLNESTDAVLDTYRREIERSNVIAAATLADDPMLWWPAEERPPWPAFHGFRSVMLHAIAETAAHAGQLDAVRELIDGRTWLILTE